MISLFSQCDEDYGKRVAEGLGMSACMSAGNMNAEMADEIATTKGKLPKKGGSPIGSSGAADAVDEAQEKGHDADPY
ncbi:hypothetical protein HFA01_27140 [Halobacillus faecis]|uniref:Uncharacterized protein n=2 Tax=Halobacillus faecis TaxID=360184 RepID=A0A511WY92_9BACI|nr:hypothetical protein HFA01_27140 [Halobacillus faecis]